MTTRRVVGLLIAGLFVIGVFGCSKEPYPGDFPRTVRLSVGIGPSTPAAATVSPNATDLSVFQIALTAGEDEQVRVTSIRFTDTGSGNALTEISSVGLFVDEDGDGNYSPSVDTAVPGAVAGTYAADDTATFAGLDRVIHPGSTEHWILVYSFSGAGVGNTFTASVNAEADVVAEGGESGRAASVSGPPVSGNQMTVVFMGSLTLGPGPSPPPAAILTMPPVTAPMLQVRLTAGPMENVNISSITFTAGGSGSADSDISSVDLYDDQDSSGTLSVGDTPIGAATTFSGGSATFGGLAETIVPGTPQDWLVVCAFSGGSAGNTYSVSLASNADVTAVGAVSALPITPTGAPVPGNLMTLQNIGTLTLSPGGSPPPGGPIANPPTNVPMLQVNLEAAGENVNVTSITFTAGGSGIADTAISAVDLWNDIDGDGTVSGPDTSIASGAVFSGGTVQFAGLSETITAGVANAEDWLVVCTFGGGNNGDTFSVNLSANADVAATGATSMLSITPTGAPVSGNLMTLQIGTLTLGPGSNPIPAGNLPVPPTNAPVFQVSLTAGAGENVNIGSITFTAGAGSGNANTDIGAVDLWVDTDGSATVSAGDVQIGFGGVFSGGTVQFPGLTETITAGTSEDWLVVCTFVAGNNGDTYRVDLALNADVAATGASSLCAITPTGAPVTGNLQTLTCIPLVITTKRVPRGQNGVAYSYTVQATGGISPYNWVATTPLPTGLVLNAGTGVISGTPTAGGQIFTVQVTDSGPPVQNAWQLLAIEVDLAGTTYGTVPVPFATITAAMAAVPSPLGVHVIEIQDNATYVENVDINVVAMAGGGMVTIRSKWDCLPTVQAANPNDHVFDNQTFGVMVIIRGLKITGATGSGMCGVGMTGSMVTSVYNCTFYGNDTAFNASGFFGCAFANNTCYGPTGIWMDGGANDVIMNNIIWATGPWAIRLDNLSPAPNFNLYHAPSGAVGYDGTTFYNTLASWQLATGGEANSLYGDPNFANLSGSDFHLTTTSALAIDRATTGWPILIDCEGYARGYGTAWDIGAYEKR